MNTLLEAPTRTNRTEVEAMATRVALHPFLAGMNPAQLALLTDCAIPVHFKKGQTILREGDLANRLRRVLCHPMNIRHFFPVCRRERGARFEQLGIQRDRAHVAPHLVVQVSGESYTLYTLSGASREAFAKFPMPRNTEVFEPTFRGKGPVRSPDILADPRYGKSEPYKGMPPGHLPVRSYLAVPVMSRGGEVLGGPDFTLWNEPDADSQA